MYLLCLLYEKTEQDTPQMLTYICLYKILIFNLKYISISHTVSKENAKNSAIYEDQMYSIKRPKLSTCVSDIGNINEFWGPAMTVDRKQAFSRFLLFRTKIF